MLMNFQAFIFKLIDIFDQLHGRHTHSYSIDQLDSRSVVKSMSPVPTIFLFSKGWTAKDPYLIFLVRTPLVKCGTITRPLCEDLGAFEMVIYRSWWRHKNCTYRPLLDWGPVRKLWCKKMTVRLISLRRLHSGHYWPCISGFSLYRLELVPEQIRYL